MTKLDCPMCGSSQTYYRRKTKDYACKSCPTTYKARKPVKSNVRPLEIDSTAVPQPNQGGPK